MPRTRLLCSFAAAFLRVCKARLCALLEQQEENGFFNVKAWVSREALNQDALQEAGTFRYRDEGRWWGGEMWWRGRSAPAVDGSATCFFLKL